MSGLPLGYRAHVEDFWLFLRRIAPNAGMIGLVLLLSAALFYFAAAWAGLVTETAG